MAQQLFHFEISRDGQKINELQLEPASIKIGSHPRSQLLVEDPDVSRVHALIELGEDGAPSIIDLGSGRGTFVNGTRVNKHALQTGDVITVGNTQIAFKLFAPNAGVGARRGAAAAAPVEVIPDSVVYSRRFLTRPARTDGTVEVAVLWRDVVLSDALYNPAVNITIGASSHADIPLDDASLTGDDFRLVEVARGEGKEAVKHPEPLLRVLPGMQGELFIETNRYTIDEAIAAGVLRPDGNAYAIPFTVGVRARIDFGHVSIFLHRSIAPVAVFPWRMTMQGALIGSFVVSALLHAIFLLIGYWMPPNYSMGGNDEFTVDSRFVQLLIADEVPPEEATPEWLQADDSAEAQADEGAIVAGEAGRAGDERAEDTGMRGTIGSTSGSGDASELARGAAREEALQTGALAALNSFAGGSVFGTGAGSYTDVVAIGGADGVAIGSSYGSGGLGSYGGGLSTGSAVGGGGGFGIGPMALRGRASGESVGRGLRDVSDRGERQVAVTPGRPEVEGQLDREIIERVIRQHRREIRACYESELQRNPSLEGRIVVGFVIDPTGQVARASIGTSTMNNNAVEECIALRVRRWRFPEPKGGGLVRVNYPFTFVAGG